MYCQLFQLPNILQPFAGLGTIKKKRQRWFGTLNIQTMLTGSITRWLGLLDSTLDEDQLEQCQGDMKFW